MDNKNTGTVKFFNSEKGFGFIKHDDSSKETFVHASGLIDEIKENDKVEFDLQNGKKGMNAVNVKLIGYNRYFNAKGRLKKLPFFYAQN